MTCHDYFWQVAMDISKASLQVSCLTSEIQKLMDSNHQLKSDISDEMKPVLLVFL